MAKKTFDCVVMKRKGAEAVRKDLAGKSPEEKRSFWRDRTDALRKQQDRSRLNASS